MKKLTVLAMVFLLAPAFSADASSKHHHRHARAHSSEPASSPSGPPVTRLPVAPDAFRA